MKSIYSITFILLVLSFSSCKEKQKPVSIDNSIDKNHVVVVQEVLHGEKYSYMNVKEKFVEFWISTDKVLASVGDTLYYIDAFEMNDFKSKELDRVFESILFVSEISNKPIKKAEKWYKEKHNTKTAQGTKYDIKLKRPDGAVSIADIYANTEKYNGKQLKLRGVVMRYNEMIMKKNWIHLQDGTDHNGEFDLTITTTDKVQLGDTIIIEGTLMLDKDFGAGYVYPVILEQATVLN